MDRGEDADWFGSDFIRTFAALATVGILGAIAWLLYTRDPVVNIRVLGDRNFALASILMVAMASVLYASAVVIPQLAQQVLGYNATLAGLLLSPGAALLTLLIPLVTGLQKIVPTKYLIAIGFASLGSAMLYSHRLTPDISFNELALMRAAQAAGLAFLFAPLTTTAFGNIRPEDNGDASALFTMFRNVSGSIGISLATAMITERTQIRMAHLAPHMTPLDQGFAITLQQYQQALLAQGHAASTIAQSALGQMYQAFRTQASVLAYMDIFGICAIMAFGVVPLAFLLSSKTGGGAHAAG
jgi:DHA2 family multidrug resistance protein